MYRANCEWPYPSFVKRFRQSSPFRINPDVLLDGESHLANIVCARSALRHEGNEIAFQEQFRADPATSHGMLVAGLLARRRSMPRLCLVARLPLRLMLRAEPVRFRSTDGDAEAAPSGAARMLAVVDIRPGFVVGLCAKFVTQWTISCGRLPDFWGVRASVDCSSFVLALSHPHGRDPMQSGCRPSSAAIRITTGGTPQKRGGASGRSPYPVERSSAAPRP